MQQVCISGDVLDHPDQKTAWEEVRASE